MDQLLIALTDKNVRKLLKNLPVQLKAHQIGSGVKIHPDMPIRQKKALARAMRSKKGVRIQFTPQELIQGSGFWDWLKGAAQTIWEKGIKPVANVVQSAYKPLMQVARPLVRQFNEPIAKAITSYTGIPVSGEQVLGAEKLSKDILGVGLKRTRGGALKTNKNRAVNDMSGILETSSTLLSPAHPIFQTNQQMPSQDVYGAMQQMASMRGSGVVFKESPKDYLSFEPTVNVPDYTVGGRVRMSAGSFLPSGYRAKGGKIVPKVGGSFKVAGMG